MALFSAFSSVLTNKHYLETNLLPLQVYYNSRKSIQVPKKLRCTLESIWKKYESIIGADRFVNVRVGEDQYKLFEYEDAKGPDLTLIGDSEEKYDITTSQNTYKISKSNVFFGIYKPLSPLICNRLQIVDNIDSNLSYLDTDKVTQLYAIWAEVEQLRLSIEAVLREIPALKF